MSVKKLLVTLDGSKRAARTIAYLCRFKPLRTREVVLFTVMTPVPESYYDLKNSAFSSAAVSQVKAWEMGQKATMKAFMENARMQLVAAGFAPDKVSIRMAERKVGIARDIIEESRKGYDALIIRRRGSANSLLAVTLGGVAAKLVDKANAVPLIVAGVQKITHSLCVATDGSEGSMRAVRFVGEMVGQTNCRVLLCSVLRDTAYQVTETGSESYVGVDPQAREFVESALESSRTSLIKAGVSSENIEIQLIQDAKSRAGALVAAAGEFGCDTLVFGRKGLSQVEDFDLGRIPRKVIYGSRKLTVWLVP